MGGGRAGVRGPATQVYRLIADFDRHHPRFLPPALTGFRVEEAAWTRGTVHSFRMNAGGRGPRFHMRVEEPDPGRVLTESDQGPSMVTTWIVDPGGPGCRVRGGDPLAGCEWVGELFERLFAPWVLRRLYADELERLDRYVRTTPPD